MKTFAVLEGQNVVNTILAESKEIAETVTEKTCIEYTNEPAEIGGTYDGVSFIARKPYPSWVLNNNKNWEAPISYPNDNKHYIWDEDIQNWKEIFIEEEVVEE